MRKDLLLSDKSTSQRGLVTLGDCQAAGMTRQQVDRRCDSAGWVRIQPRVYLLPGQPDDPYREALAAVLSAGDTAVVAMHTAAALHGLSRIGRLTPTQICLAQSHQDQLWDVTVHRTRRLEACDITVVEGIPATSPARTLIDLAAVIDKIALTALLDDAMGLRLVTRSWMHRRAQALRNGRRGVGNLVALTTTDAENKFRSWLERRAAFVLQSGRVPTPLWNEPIRHHGRLLGVADACWSSKRLIAEFDGLAFHSTPQQRQADAERERELVLAGWRVLRFSWLDVTQQPDRVVATLNQALT